MTNPYRAMCAELVQKWDDASCDQDLLDVDDAIEHARALLAQPVAEGPTDEELWELYDDKLGQFGFAEDWPWIRNYARAALAKWGAND